MAEEPEVASSNKFGILLRKERQERGITLRQLSIMIGVTLQTVDRWEAGKTLPRIEHINRILDAFRLSTEKRDYLLSLYVDAGMENKLQPMDLYVPSESAQLAEAMQRLQGQIDQIGAALSNVTQQVALGAEIPRDDSGTTRLSKDLEELRVMVDGLAHTGERLTAQVEVPAAEHMKVKLVPATFIARMEEYTSDSVIWYALAGALGGAILGIIVNSVTGGEMTPTAWALIVIFFVLMSVFVVLIRRNEERLLLAKWQILGIGIDPIMRRELLSGGITRLWTQWVVGRWFRVSSQQNTKIDSSLQQTNRNDGPSADGSALGEL